MSARLHGALSSYVELCTRMKGFINYCLTLQHAEVVVCQQPIM